MGKGTNLSLVLIISLGFVVYFNSLGGKFIWDDEFLVRDNVYIKSWSNIKKILAKDIGAGADKEYYFYRPIQMLAYTLDYSLWKLKPTGYHLTNIILHILAALAIYWLINILYADKFISFITAALFTVNPIHTEAVTYISGRADPLAALFLLLALAFYIKLTRTNAISSCLFSLFAYLLAVLSKEYALVLPLLILSYHYVFRVKLRLKCFLPILAITLLYILTRLTILSYLIPPKGAVSTSLFQRLPGIFVALTQYIKLLFLPLNLHMEYGSGMFRFAEIRAISGILIFISLLSLAFLKRKSNNLLSFGIFWFFVALFPQSNLFPVNAYMTEHWLYLPSIGFLLILAGGLNYLYKIRNSRFFAAAFSAGIIILYSFLTIRQNSYWREPVSFYERTLKYAPFSSKVFYNLGSAYKESGRLDKARVAYKKAIEINPAYAQAYNSLGVVAEKKEEAITLYKKAIAVNPGYAKAYNNIGNAYKEIGKSEEAISAYRKAIEINPDYADAYYNLGIVYAAIGKSEDAVSVYRKAIEVNPDYAYAYNNLALIYYDLDRYKEAITLYEKAIKVYPGYLDAHYNLALAYYYSKQYSLAAKHFQTAAALGYKVPAEFLKIFGTLSNKQGAENSGG